MSGGNAVISVGKYFRALLTLRDRGRFSWQVAGVWVRDRDGQTTVGQLLMEPMGPVCVCVHVRMLCPRTCTLQHNRDGNWLMMATWLTMTDTWIVMLMSRGSNWPLPLRIFKSQLSFLRWHMRIGAQSYLCAFSGNPIGHLAILFESITSQAITAGAWLTIQNGSHMSSNAKKLSGRD